MLPECRTQVVRRRARVSVFGDPYRRAFLLPRLGLAANPARDLQESRKAELIRYWKGLANYEAFKPGKADPMSASPEGTVEKPWTPVAAKN
jgi:hypothetical protein